jgi:hypothetical protein
MDGHWSSPLSRAWNESNGAMTDCARSDPLENGSLTRRRVRINDQFREFASLIDERVERFVRECV